MLYCINIHITTKNVPQNHSTGMLTLFAALCIADAQSENREYFVNYFLYFALKFVKFP